MSKEFYDPNDFKTEEISPSRVDLHKTPKENVDSLRPDFEKAGIFIGADSVIANSTLLKLIDLVNILLVPHEGTYKQRKELNDAVAVTGLGLSEDAIRLAEFMDEVSLARNLNIHIGSKVAIGENFSLLPGLSVGDGTQIGDSVEIKERVEIGINCKIGKSCWLGGGCSIGDHVVADDATTFPPSTVVPSDCRVVHKGPHSSIARIENF